MDRLDTAVLDPVMRRAAILARIDVLERETSAVLLRGVASAADYKVINDILGRQHAEALVFAARPHRQP